LPIAPSNSVAGKSRAIPLLVLAAVGACLCITAAGWLHSEAARKLSESRDWIEHSQSVISNLQSQSLRLERIDAALRIYELNHDEQQLRNAESEQVAFSMAILRLQQLVSDNPRQVAEARKFENCSNALGRSFTQPDLQKQAAFAALLECKQNLGNLQEVERELITDRTAESKVNSQRSIFLSIGFTVLSILVILALFGFMLRDAFRREQYERRLSEANDKLGATIRTLERQAKDSALLTSLRDELQLCTKATQAQECAARHFEQLLPGTSGTVNIIDDRRHIVEVASVWGKSRRMMDTFPLDGCCGLRLGRARWRKPMQSEVHCTHFNSVAPELYLCVPLAAYGDTLGVIYVECVSPGVAAMVDANTGPLHEMIELISIAIAGLNLRSRLEHQSIRDSLTGLFNRHFMEIALDRELRRSARHDKPVAIMMLDIDHFKEFNDTYGHEAGDTVLRELGEVLLQSVRNEDILCRYGGEEFVAIFPETDLYAATDRAEGLRRIVSEMRVRIRGEALREITLSIGVAAYPLHAETMEEVMRAADRALYEAKHRGRNCVVSAETALLA
jgi:diguanylate cyclase (GGDEF)-like protein